jgi:hypothetical protein
MISVREPNHSWLVRLVLPSATPRLDHENLKVHVRGGRLELDLSEKKKHRTSEHYDRFEFARNSLRR